MQKLSFEKHGVEIIKDAVGVELCEFIRSYLDLRADAGLLDFGDSQVPHALRSYGDPVAEALLDYYQPMVEDLTGKTLLPCNSYLRIYSDGNALARHLDRASCEISLTLNVGQTHPWPIFVEINGKPRAIKQKVGDALLYRGPYVPHWREPFEGDRYYQIFLHYVDVDGPYKECAFDGRKGLMLPRREYGSSH